MKTLKRILAFFAWIIVGMFAIGFMMVFFGIIAVFSGGLDNDLSEITSPHAVGIVELEGEILSSEKFTKRIRKLVKNDAIKAVVVRVDSPGGTVGASEEIFAAIRRAREKKPVVCSLGSIAASGGLYAAVGCDKIVTNLGTLTGSIGVVLMMPNLTKVMDDFGVKMNVIKSGRFKDAGSPFRPLNEKDRTQLQSIVDLAHRQFVTVVAESRGLEFDTVNSFSDGRIIVGEEALNLGLVDASGDVVTAAKMALEIAGDSGEPDLIYPKEKTGLMGLLEGFDGEEVSSWISRLRTAQVMYLAFL